MNENICTAKKSTWGIHNSRKFGRNKDLLARDARGFDSFSDGFLGALFKLTFESGFVQWLRGSLTVDMSGIDVAESILERNGEFGRINDWGNEKGKNEEVLLYAYL